MNRMKTILLMGVGLLMTLPAAAETGVARVQKPIGDGTQDQQEQSRQQAVQAMQERLKLLEEKSSKAPSHGKKDSSDFAAQMSQFKADLDKMSSPGGDDGSKGGADKKKGAAKTTTSIPEIPNSDSNYLDDHLNWNMPIHVYRAGSDGGPDKSNAFCLKADTGVVGLSSSFNSVTEEGQKSAASYLPVRLDTTGTWWGVDPVKVSPTAPVKAPEQATGSGDTDAALCDNIDKDTSASPFSIYADTQFYVSQGDLERAKNRVGWDYGTLIVPFKFQMSDKSIVTGSASLGGYVGYSLPLDLPGFRLRPIGFVGVSEISIPNTDGGKGKNPTSTVAGLSYGVGLMGTIKDKFNISLVFGADHVSGSKYQYQDKPWVSFALGYSFTQ